MTGREERIKYDTKIEKNLLRGKPAYFQEYVNSLTNISIRTRINYLRYVIKFMEWTGKNPNELKANDFTGFIATSKYNGNGKENTSGYLINVYAALKKFSKYLFFNDIIREDYMLKIDRPRQVDSQETIQKREKGILTVSETKTMLNKLNAKILASNGEEHDELVMDLAIIYVLLTTGMRLSALVALDLDDFNRDQKTLRVVEKGSKYRIFYLNDKCLYYLDNYLPIRNKYIGAGEQSLFIHKRMRVIDAWWNNPVNGDRVITYERIKNTDVQHIVSEHTSFITDRKISPHKLRATYGTQLYENTKDIYFVQKCMGHKSPQTTELYIREKENKTKQASQIVGNLF